MRALFLVVVAACGRIGFDRPGDGDRPFGDVGSSCVVDDDCAACLRCNAELVCQAEPIVDVFAGHRITCFIGASGSRWCVGESDGFARNASSRFEPRRIPGEDGWTLLALGWLSHLGIRNGETWEWNDQHNVSIDPKGDWDLVMNEMDGHCFLDASGALTCAGTTATGTWSTVTSGAGHFCGIQSDQSLWCWGNNLSNALGQGVQPEASVVDAPARVGTDNDWIDVGTGERLSCGMKADHSLWCWGMANFTGTNMIDTLGIPMQITDDTNWSWLEVNWNRACAGRPDGRVACWGGDGYGLEVIPGMDMVPVPMDLGIVVEEFVMGGHHNCARIAGEWSCWGWNQNGQLTNGDTVTHQFPGVPLCSGG